MIQTLLTCFLLSLPSQAKPQEALSAADVCKTIDSNKYQAQCESAIHAGRFSPLAIKACRTHKKRFDYQLSTCMGAIKDKSFTQEQIDVCLSKKKDFLNKCLSDAGTPFKTESNTELESTSVGN